MPLPIARPSRQHLPMGVISAAAAGAVAAGFLLCSAPAQAANGDMAIASIDLGSPAKPAGVVKAQVNVDVPAGTSVTYAVTKPAKGSASINRNGVLTYTPTPAARHAAARTGAKISDRTDVVRVTVADASGHRASKQARLPILAANQAPVIDSVVVGRPDPTTGVVQGRINVTDPDGDALTFRITSDTAASSAQRSITTSDLRPRSVQTAKDGATTIVCPSSQGALGLNAATGSFTYTPTAPNPSTGVVTGEATDSFTVTVNDGYGGTTSVPVSVPTGSYSAGIQ